MNLIKSIIEHLVTTIPNDSELGQSIRRLNLINLNPYKQVYNSKKYTQEYITELQPNEIFVFGSNSMGQHWGGSAKTAHEKFGAIWGQGYGPQGQSYAIATINLPSQDKDAKQLSIAEIYFQVLELYKYAELNKDKTFYMTKIGTNRAGFSLEEIAELFQCTGKVPDNVILPIEFVSYLPA